MIMKEYIEAEEPQNVPLLIPKRVQGGTLNTWP